MALTRLDIVRKGLRDMVNIGLRWRRPTAGSHELFRLAVSAMQPAMKTLLLSLFIMLAAALPARAEKALVALAPVPFGFVVPQEIASHLSTGPLTGSWAEEVRKAGARAAVTVYYQPEAGEKTILFSAYYFDAERWDAAQKPDEPPPFGEPVVRGDGRVLSVAGPHDVIFDPATPDGKNVLSAVDYLRDPASFKPVE